MQGNGAVAPNAMAVGPTPAGHQAELNIIYGMVEELSRQLNENRRFTEDIVSGLGRVRQRAHERGLGNEELLGEAADDIFALEPQLETMVSVLTEALERAKQSRDANFSLLATYAKVFESMINQFHAYKQKHVADITTWHRSYRAQLAEARAENCRLREQMWEMQENAARADDMLREFRKKFDEDEHRWDKRVRERAKKQELRFWKRMAMPEINDDEEGFWSDDDDIVDPAEKERLEKIRREVAEQALAVGSASSSQQSEDSEGERESSRESSEVQSLSSMMGGIAMVRDPGSEVSSVPQTPPRPASAGSSPSSTGGQAPLSASG